MLALLVVVPLLAAWRWYGRGGGGVSFSAVDDARLAGRSVRQRLTWLPEVLRYAALVLLIIALARLQFGQEKTRDVSQGIAIQMVVDRSSSMGAEIRYRGRYRTRLDIVKDVFRDFVNGDGDVLSGRQEDLVGLITFARYPDTICPLTLSHDLLDGFVDIVKLVDQPEEDGTAIGDALALAAARLQEAEESLRNPDGEIADYQIKSKVIILLSDGENNAGNRTMQQAAKLAAASGIKVYTIGVGGEAQQVVKTPFGAYRMPVQSQVDEEGLNAVAKLTGGLYRLARNAESLRSIYQEIDQLEKSEIESVRYVDYRELFGPFALGSLACLSLALLLTETLFRRIS